MINNAIFEIRKSPVDKHFRVWVLKSAVELGIVSRNEFNRLGQPVYLQTSYQVCIGVFKNKPNTATVLALIKPSKVL